MDIDIQERRQEADIQIETKEILKKKALKRAFIEFLEGKSKGYTAWITITFRQRVSQEVAQKMIKRFFHKLNKGNLQFYNNFLSLILFYENNPSAPGVHVHCLASGIDPRRFGALSQRLFKQFGENWVKGIHDNVNNYLATKYVEEISLDHFMFQKINSHTKTKKMNVI